MFIVYLLAVLRFFTEATLYSTKSQADDGIQFMGLNLHMNQTREALAAIQYEIWASWVRYLFEVSQQNQDGTYSIPVKSVQQWQRQMNTDYAALSEQEKDGDREQGDKVLTLMSIGS